MPDPIVVQPGELIALEPQKRGDTWFGFDIEIGEESGVDFTDAVVSMAFTDDIEKAKQPVLTTETDPPGITVLSPLSIRVNKGVLPLKLLITWYWDLQFDLKTGPYAGCRLTLWHGTLPITPDQTL